MAGGVGGLDGQAALHCLQGTVRATSAVIGGHRNLNQPREAGTAAMDPSAQWTGSRTVNIGGTSIPTYLAVTVLAVVILGMIAYSVIAFTVRVLYARLDTGAILTQVSRLAVSVSTAFSGTGSGGSYTDTIHTLLPSRTVGVGAAVGGTDGSGRGSIYTGTLFADLVIRTVNIGAAFSRAGCGGGAERGHWDTGTVLTGFARRAVSILAAVSGADCGGPVIAGILAVPVTADLASCAVRVHSAVRALALSGGVTVLIFRTVSSLTGFQAVQAANTVSPVTYRT